MKMQSRWAIAGLLLAYTCSLSVSSQQSMAQQTAAPQASTDTGEPPTPGQYRSRRAPFTPNARPSTPASSSTTGGVDSAAAAPTKPTQPSTWVPNQAAGNAPASALSPVSGAAGTQLRPSLPAQGSPQNQPSQMDPNYETLPANSVVPNNGATPAQNLSATKSDLPDSVQTQTNQTFIINKDKVEDAVSKSDDNHQLTGAAHYKEVTAQAKQLAAAPLSKCRDEEMKFVEVTFKNNSPDIAVVLGDNASADAGAGAGALRALPLGPIRQTARPGLSKAGTAAVTTVGLGSLGLAGPMFYELMTPGQHAKRSLGTAIGEDGSRHEIEASIFGTRVIMPGDETVGWMAFRTPAADSQIKNLHIPISFTHSYVPDGSLIIPVAQPEHSLQATAPTSR